MLKQQFEIEIEGNNGIYKYELEIEHAGYRPLVRISHEKLTFNQNSLLEFKQGNAQLYHDDHTPGPEYPFDWSRSALASLPSRHDNTKLTWFKKWIEKIILVQINPVLMKSESNQISNTLDFQCANFVDWYKKISENQGNIIEITNTLKEVINGFQYFHFEPTGENQVMLKVQISNHQYRFHELSLGQRALIILYTLIHYAQNQGCTLCIDEPENFVSLPEIQPWIFEVKDFCADGKMQAVLISHHPEYINDLAESAGIWFERNPDFPVRIRKINHEGELALSELVARGWINE